MSFKTFAQRKGVTPGLKLYGVTCLSHMALGLFASLIIGLILKTLGNGLGVEALVTLGTTAMGLMGAAIGVAVAYALGAPPLVLYSALVTGSLGAALGGPAGALLATLVAVEGGKLVAKETPLDIVVTPLVTLVLGYLVSVLVAPPIASALTGLGQTISWATELRPILMGAIVATVMGLALTAPISSAAIAIMLDLNGLAAGAATVGCAAQMIGFAAAGYRDNGVGPALALGLGTSMLMIGNIARKPLILVPPTLAGALLGPLATTVFSLSSNAAGAGMGTSGLVGPIMVVQTMGVSSASLLGIAVLCVLGPALIAFASYLFMCRQGWIHPGDFRLSIE
ncbi:PTS transporter subunit IIC [Larsenimonas suaedae]|uniref:PTS sugar transporter subunit IIC n=1 Tax=Larsenimonas suaedae TaxID=1851019 RepID=A0ABU1GR09_9GAMM|nr:PTS sugar transporter subunit IIC [Larsenimonas suaedae]MCM2972739.1 PTS sugar transporter subunit IIC [Larsenimonas suaedae]MDR5894464.1 PTS sugar transporter subunit IIC [Larsenimonas suaedae]